MADELKPCPFCGSRAEMDTRQSFRPIFDGKMLEQVCIYCASCSASVSHYPGDLSFSREDTIDLCVYEWNTRPAAMSDDADMYEAPSEKGPIRGPTLHRFSERRGTCENRCCKADDYHSATPNAMPSDDLVERMAELQLAAFLAGRGSVTNMMHGTRTCKPAPSMDDFRRMVIAALAGEQ